MGSVQGVLRSERWLDEVVVSGTELNLDGDGNVYVAMPAGLVSLAVMECLIDVSPLATNPTSLESFAARWVVTRISDDAITDLIGVSEFHYRGSAAAAAYVSPDPLVLWYETERVQVSFPELDINAAPTGDVAILIKCVRVRPVDSAPSGLRLVR